MYPATVRGCLWMHLAAASVIISGKEKERGWWGNADQCQSWLLDWSGFLVPSLNCRVSRESLKSPVIWIEKWLASLKARRGLTWVSQNLGGEGSDHKQQAQKPRGDLHGGGRQLDVSALTSASLPLCLSALLAILSTFIGSRVGGSFQRRR